MKRPFLKFCKGLRNALIVCGLMTAVHYKRVCKVTLAIAPFALVQKAKKLNPDMTAEEEVTLSFARSCADVLEFGIARVIDLGSDPTRARRER